MRELFFRHGDILTHTYIVTDAHYFSEPMIKTNGFRLTANDNVNPYPCQSVEEVDRPRGVVPHHLPGQNPYASEFAERYNLPLEATRGGANSALPEFIKQFDTTETMQAN